MGNVTIALIFVTVMNLLMVLAQLSAHNINPDLNTYTMCTTSDGTFLEGANSTSSANIIDTLPASGADVSTTGSPGLGTDIYNAIISWFKTNTGVKYLTMIVTAPISVFACVLPSSLLALISTAWYSITAFLLFAFIMWRD